MKSTNLTPEDQLDNRMLKVTALWKVTPIPREFRSTYTMLYTCIDIWTKMERVNTKRYMSKDLIDDAPFPHVP
eukprot:232365-Amphidinium_carterae.2